MQNIKSANILYCRHIFIFCYQHLAGSLYKMSKGHFLQEEGRQNRQWATLGKICLTWVGQLLFSPSQSRAEQEEASGLLLPVKTPPIYLHQACMGWRAGEGSSGGGSWPLSFPFIPQAICLLKARLVLITTPARRPSVRPHVYWSSFVFIAQGRAGGVR